MNSDIKKLWLEALRSGDYDQGIGCLRDTDDQFCCFGVLCDLYATKNDDLNRWRYTQKHGPVEYDGEWNFPPRYVKVWAGLAATADEYIPSMNTSLAQLNDAAYTFNYIADIIEEHL